MKLCEAPQSSKAVNEQSRQRNGRCNNSVDSFELIQAAGTVSVAGVPNVSFLQVVGLVVAPNVVQMVEGEHKMEVEQSTVEAHARQVHQSCCCGPNEGPMHHGDWMGAVGTWADLVEGEATNAVEDEAKSAMEDEQSGCCDHETYIPLQSAPFCHNCSR